MIWIRSLLFTSVLFLSVPFYATGAVLGAPLGSAFVYRFAEGWSRFNLRALKLLCGLDYELEGEENIPGSNCIVYWKHQSVFEIMASTQILPRQTWVAKRELLWLPFFGWGFAMLEPISINRGAGRSAVKQVITQGRDRLARGFWLIIFPEGTRVAPGTTRRYGASGAALAAETGCPILPVAHNAGDFWPRRGWLKHPGTVRIVIGPPIEPGGRSPAELNQLAQAWIEGRMAEISPAYGNVAKNEAKSAETR
ncbi:MAG: lysophospholipid acyltransferase family protein [Gammaproteobacteria bacterium]